MGLAAVGSAVIWVPTTMTLAATVAALTIVARVRRRARRARAAEERRVLAGALEVLVGELRVGAHPVRAFEIAAREAAGTVAQALSAVAARARLGGDVMSGLRTAAASSALEAEWGRIAVAWQMANEHGLAISVVMRTTAADIVDRQRFWAQMQANMAGARASAAILAALPVLGIFLGQLIGAAPMAFLAGGGVGGWLLVVGTVLLCAGLSWADRITDRFPA